MYSGANLLGQCATRQADLVGLMYPARPAALVNALAWAESATLFVIQLNCLQLIAPWCITKRVTKPHNAAALLGILQLIPVSCSMMEYKNMPLVERVGVVAVRALGAFVEGMVFFFCGEGGLGETFLLESQKEVFPPRKEHLLAFDNPRIESRFIQGFMLFIQKEINRVLGFAWRDNQAQ